MNAVMNSVAHACVPAALEAETGSPVLLPSIENDVATLESAVSIVTDDIEAGLAEPVIAALARLKVERPPTFMRFRAELRKANDDIRLPQLDAMVTALAPEMPGSEDGGEGGTVEKIIGMVQALGELFTGTDDEPYVRILREGHHEVWALASDGFREWVAFNYYADNGRAPRAAQLADAFATLAGFARHEGETHEVHLRVAVDRAGGYLLDTGDDRWRVIRCTAAGWQVFDDSPVRFRRTKGTRPLPVPDSSGTRADLFALVNVADADELLVVTALLECFRPDTAYPVIEWSGEQGSGKSTSAANCRALVDPKDVLLRANPKSVEDVFVGARNNHVVNYNNLSHLSGELQDALCTLSTGGGHAGRRLYTNDEEAVYDAKRPVFMNGITTLATQADLLSRVVRIECPPLGGERVSDADLAAVMETRGPRALGYLLNTFCRALARLPSIELSRPPRLMDFARLGEAIAQGEGEALGHFSALYDRALEAAAVQSIESTPVIEALVCYARENSPIIETVGDLLQKLEQHAGPRRDTAWPKTAKGLSDALRRAAPALRLMGVEVTFGAKGNAGRSVTVRCSSSSVDVKGRISPSPPSPPSPNRPESDGRDGRDGDSGVLTHAAEEEPPPSTPAPAPAAVEEF